MGCPSSVELGDSIPFTITTHDPATGGEADADSLPTFRVYEALTGTPISSGNMAKLDDANTVGFYGAQVECTEANGYEAEVGYNIKIRAVVNGYAGGISYGFMVTDIGGLVWAHTPRGLTQVAAQVIEALSGSTINIYRGDTFTVTITGLGSLAAYVSLDFTVKKHRMAADSQSIVRIRLNQSGSDDGLLVLNGAPATGREANGSITIDDASAGDITITLEAVETDDLAPQSGLYYDVQLITALSVTTLTYGSCAVLPDVTRAVS